METFTANHNLGETESEAVTMSEALLGKVQCGSGFRRDCVRGDKCRMWHIGEPAKLNNDKAGRKNYSMRSTVLNSPIVEAKRRKNTPEKKKLAEENSGCGDQRYKFNFKIHQGVEMKAKIQYRIDSLRPVYGHNNSYYKTGLKNLGNTCYMNSIIQCLVNTEVFINLLSAMPKASSNQTLTGISDELQFLANILRSGEYRSVSPVDFKRKLGKVEQRYLGNQQHDAQEVLTSILDNIETEIKQKSEQIGWPDSMFDGHITEKTECANCRDTATFRNPSR